MPKQPADVTDTELAILNALWQRGSAQIRDVVEDLYGQHSPALHATVKSLLARLTDKGLVACDRSQFAHRFSSTLSRESFVGGQLQKLADCHFQGSLAPMLSTLVDQVKLGRADREAIRKIIDSIRM